MYYLVCGVWMLKVNIGSIGITTALALSLFQDGAAVNPSLYNTAFYISVFARASDSELRLSIITVDIVDNDGIVDNNGEFVHFHFFFLNFHLKINF